MIAKILKFVVDEANDARATGGLLAKIKSVLDFDPDRLSDLQVPGITFQYLRSDRLARDGNIYVRKHYFGAVLYCVSPEPGRAEREMRDLLPSFDAFLTGLDGTYTDAGSTFVYGVGPMKLLPGKSGANSARAAMCELSVTVRGAKSPL